MRLTFFSGQRVQSVKVGGLMPYQSIYANTSPQTLAYAGASLPCDPWPSL